MDDDNAALERNGGMSLQNEQETELALSPNGEVYVCDGSNHQQAITQVEGESSGILAAKFGMEYTETQIPDNDNQLLCKCYHTCYYPCGSRCVYATYLYHILKLNVFCGTSTFIVKAGKESRDFMHHSDFSMFFLL